MTEKLTTRNYWENYYKNNHADKKHIVNTCSQYDSYWDEFIKEDSQSKSIIEIGGYPGRYLAYLADKYKLEPTCLDYNSDTTQIERTFAVMNVGTYHLLDKDFTEYQTEVQYDYVISLGFVEHFDDFNAILDKHTAYLKPGGKMLIMIPNKRYLRRFYGYLLDYKNLKAHNLKCMSLKTFQDFGQRNNLKVSCLEYNGGFQFSVHQKLNFLQKLIFKATRIIFKFGLNPYIEKHPSKYLSASIIGVFEKPV
jgi:2-polyprenyl-3-methyl-5-hydroxy-6-metoxy-1,4-benzoquinol methylase